MPEIAKENSPEWSHLRRILAQRESEWAWIKSHHPEYDIVDDDAKRAILAEARRGRNKAE